MGKIELMVVEDDPIQQGIYLEWLRGFDLQVSFCHNFASVLGLSSLVSAQAVIVDLNLPDGDGVAAIEEIIKQANQAPYILVVTSSKNETEHQRARDAGANEVLVKPIKEEQMKGLLGMLLS